MKLKVMYHSRGGNTKKVAEAIAASLDQVSEAVPPAYPLENIGVLFLGAAIYQGKIDKKVKDFIVTLNTKRVKNVALFSTSGSQDKALPQMRDLLKAQGINVLEETFFCKGQSLIFLNRNRPNTDDLNKAKEFAKSVVSKIKE